ncbi:hypothetical protein TEA_020126 [Camellia sinensis var. sinensis]|uniref:Protein kinase domain-containing protein n=1 Tax=Camellia sinensis var. sinensis TaxID=542762 RepID=A0A4S4DI78_CAMSN|nr:hypothetical protein TEA_020126 [Camellia sinensis var. sinensis]
MGNVCVGSRFSKDGFFQSISHSLWSRSPDMIPYTKREITSSEVPSLAKDPDGSQSVQNKPPQLVKIVKEETKQEELIISEPVKIVKEEIKPAKPTIPEPVKTVKEETKPAQPTRPRKAHNVKRMASAGLQAESLLKTKTGDELFDRIVKRAHYTERKAAELAGTIVGVIEARGISESAKDLVRKMLVKDPKKRQTAHGVLCHPWVQVDGVAPISLLTLQS